MARREDLSVEPVDLRDYPMPFYEQVVPPARGQRDYPPKVARWAEKLDAADGYMIVTPEYNHGYPAELKNALDQVFPELNRKPVAFIGYGNTGGRGQSSSCASSVSSSRWRRCDMPCTSCRP